MRNSKTTTNGASDERKRQSLRGSLENITLMSIEMPPSSGEYTADLEQIHAGLVQDGIYEGQSGSLIRNVHSVGRQASAIAFTEGLPGHLADEIGNRTVDFLARVISEEMKAKRIGAETK